MLKRVFTGLNLKEEEVSNTVIIKEVKELHAAFTAVRINP